MAKAKQKASKAKESSESEVQVDRRSDADRRDGDRRQAEVTVDQDRRQGERRKVQRRRQIDPTTCERDYSGEEIEFMQAMDAYKRASGRMFPTCSEILEVIRSLGYQKVAEGDATIPPPYGSEASESVPAAEAGAADEPPRDAAAGSEAS